MEFSNENLSFKQKVLQNINGSISIMKTNRTPIEVFKSYIFINCTRSLFGTMLLHRFRLSELVFQSLINQMLFFFIRPCSTFTSLCVTSMAVNERRKVEWRKRRKRERSKGRSEIEQNLHKEICIW